MEGGNSGSKADARAHRPKPPVPSTGPALEPIPPSTGPTFAPLPRMAGREVPMAWTNRWVLGPPPRVGNNPELIFHGAITAQVEEGVFTLEWEIYDLGLLGLTIRLFLRGQAVQTIHLYYWSTPVALGRR